MSGIHAGSHGKTCCAEVTQVAAVCVFSLVPHFVLLISVCPLAASSYRCGVNEVSGSMRRSHDSRWKCCFFSLHLTDLWVSDAAGVQL